MNTPVAAATHQQTVLVVDDTPANLGVVVECLESNDLRVTIARDGWEALRRSELTQPDLILLDVMMPGIDGFETCRRLKQQHVTRDIPVIFMTSLAHMEEKVAGFMAGAVDYVTKPLQVDEVAARVKTHLKLRALQKMQTLQNEKLQQEVEFRKQAERALVDMMDGVRNVSNAIAHDLRTPLTELRSRLEVLSLTRPGPAETFHEIESAMADVDRVIGIFNALLRLAEIDSGVQRSGFLPTDLQKIVSDAVDFYLPVAELNGISISYVLHASQPAIADPLLVAQALGNLIDNALKFSRPGGHVEVAVHATSGDDAWISVTDNGPGISECEKHKVIQRFYRGDASRGTPGVGLGLALVAAVAHLHHGTLLLQNNSPGLKATLILRRTA
jgi:two-component system sensor histidine kinase/response regulator